MSFVPCRGKRCVSISGGDLYGFLFYKEGVIILIRSACRLWRVGVIILIRSICRRRKFGGLAQDSGRFLFDHIDVIILSKSIDSIWVNRVGQGVIPPVFGKILTGEQGRVIAFGQRLEDPAQRGQRPETREFLLLELGKAPLDPSSALVVDADLFSQVMDLLKHDGFIQAEFSYQGGQDL